MATIQEAIQNLRDLRNDLETLAARLNVVHPGMAEELFDLDIRAGEVLADLHDIQVDEFIEREGRATGTGHDTGLFLDELCELMATTDTAGA